MLRRRRNANPFGSTNFVRQSGTGPTFLQAVSSFLPVSVDVATMNVGDLLKSETAAGIKNSIPDSDKNARPSFAGETHMILELPNGKNGIANYMGPGTNVPARIERGDPPRTFSDKVAQAHDLRYANAQNLDMIRTADNKMVETLREGRIKDARRNILAGEKLISAKIGLEDLGILSKDAFSGKVPAQEPMTPAMEQKLEQLEMEGFGLPGYALKTRLLKKHSGSGDVVKFAVRKLLPALIKRIKKGGIKPAVEGKINGRELIKSLIPRTSGLGPKEVANVMSGDFLSILNDIFGMPGAGSPALNDQLTAALHTIVKNFKKGKSGTGFLDDFGKGFVKGFVGTFKAVAPLLPLLV